MSQEVEIEIGCDDIRGALAEQFAIVAVDGSHAGELTLAFSCIAKFFNALADEQIALLTINQRRVVGNYLSDQAKRFAITEVAGHAV
jgi:hypothetical protein